MIFLNNVGPCAKDLEVDLVNAYDGTLSHDNYGLVRLCMNGRRKPICDTNWNENEARVACQSAGYSPYGIKCMHQVQFLYIVHICSY